MRKIPFISLFVAALFVAVNVSACGMGEQVNGYENSDVNHAHTHWQAGDKSPIPFMFLDVRTPDEYRDGHIQGAVLIPVQELGKRLAEVPKDKRVYVYCHSGRRSVIASNMLVKGGFGNIENIEGGIVAWKKAGYPVVK
ncbi:MAG: rhodanese-like domain-containing protein [Mariprofundaceae bacterium]|nr:rhodanese-like domain-containing protein [Mariprofundaceae bacterium]